MATVEVKGLLGSIQPPPLSAFGELAGVGMLGTVIAFTLIASAESLFSAAAVDRLHSGPRTEVQQELVAQGAGNMVCGVLGALPMTAVIVRSAANVQAGARTKASRVLHGVWLLLFAALLPDVLAYIPIPALAGVLIHAGSKLIPVKSLAVLWREHRGEALVLATTAVCIVAVSMFEGVLIGLALAVVKTAWGGLARQAGGRGQGRGPGGGAPVGGTPPSCGCRRSRTAWNRCPRTARSSSTCPGCTTWTTPAVPPWRTGPNGTVRRARSR